MQYFTTAWHSGELDESYDPRKEYQKHLAALLPDCPSDVQTLAVNINVHDGLLWQKAEETAQNCLRLSLRCGDLRVGYFDLELHYLQVLFLPSLTEELAGLAAAPIHGDLQSSFLRSEALYDEVDREGDLFVHRILFHWRHDYQEITVRFKQLGLKTTPREGRYSIA